MAGSRLLKASVLAFALTVTACRTKEPPPVSPPGPAPDSFRVTFETSKGTLVVEINRTWAPHGADRFYHLASEHFFDDARFFRVLPRYIAQVGLTDDRKANDKWRSQPIPDDSLVESNRRGTLSFASEGPNSRTHQLFFNLKDNPRLDKLRFVPIGRVVSGVSVLDSLYDGYGDAPSQTGIRARGNAYLATFPRLDYIRTARVLK
ncbi:MAG TPA: peptidylprolyl isomerase [Gemmatimonadaceae bacterium]